MPTFISVRRLLLAAICLLGLVPLAHAQSDQINLDAGLPTRLEDAYPTAWGNREFQLPVRYQRSRQGDNLVQYTPTLEFGPFRNTQLAVAVPLYSGNGDRSGSGNVQVSGLYNFNTEGKFLPALALAGTLTVPTGLRSEGTDYNGRFILTKSFLGTLNRLHLNVVYFHNSQPGVLAEGGALKQERLDRFALLVGYSTRISPQSSLVLDFVREQRRFRGELGSLLEAGIRRQMNPRLVLSAGASAGLGTDADKFTATLGLQHAF
jgi:hypothetical protein